jgi:predicted nucleic acid-binding protein
LIVYFDTSALIKLYYPEAESEALAEWIRENNIAISISPFHEIELCNAFALKLFRNEISQDQFEMLMDCLSRDKRYGALIALHLNFSDVLLSAADLSRRHTGILGCRSLDIIHVASAIAGNFEHFLSFDHRQNALAEKSGLKMVNMESAR